MRIKNKPYKMTVQVVLLLILIGFTSGILSGLVGVGGGIIVVPALVFFLGFSQPQAQGTSLGLLLLPVGILAVINYYNNGNIDVRVIAIMAIAFVIGGWLGSKWAISLPEITVKRIFAVILFYTAIKMMGWDEVLVRAVKNIFS
jgi:uncharacterized membrane protein YfcA